MRGERKGAKWVAHYSSDHQILLVGEGDFSFSLSLANSFGSAANIVATSLDSYDDVTKKYKDAKSNLDKLWMLGAYLLHGVDATKMKFYSYFEMRRFDRVIFNFPHAGFHGKEDNLLMIKMHKDLVLGFFKNASCMLLANGEIHVNHKTTAPFSNWNIEKLALQSSLTLIECVDFKKEDYPGYNNKRGDGCRCDEPFPLGKCGTFKFIYSHRATRNCERSNMVVPRQQTNISYQKIYGIQDAVEHLPTRVDLGYYHETSHIPKINETMFGLPSRYTQNLGTTRGIWWYMVELLLLLAIMLMVGRSLGSQISLQPMESLQSLQPRPTSTDGRYSVTDHVRTMDIVPSSLSARNEGYQVFGGSSTYLREALCRTTQRESYAFDRVRPDFGGSSNYLQELCRTTQRESYSFDRVRPDFGGDSNYLQGALCRTTRECYSFDRSRPDFGGSSNYWRLEAHRSRTVERASSFDGVRSDFERYIAEVAGRTLNDDIYFQNELHAMSISMSERRMFAGY